MLEKTQNKKNEAFKAFSAMKMQSLWDADKIKDAHMKNLKTLKDAHGIVSETFKKVSEAHTKHLKTQHAEAKVEAEGVAKKLKSEYSKKEHIHRVKAHQAEVAEKVKASHAKILNGFKEKIDALKQHHSKLHAKLHETQHEHSEKLKEKMKAVQDHSVMVAGAWKDSTQKIMDLMKKTADHHLNKN